jgi:hypothetical protein
MCKVDSWMLIFSHELPKNARCPHELLKNARCSHGLPTRLQKSIQLPQLHVLSSSVSLTRENT